MVVMVVVVAVTAACTPPTPPHLRPVLVFSKTSGFRHGSIAAGIAAVRKLGQQHGYPVEATEDARAFTTANLGRFGAVVFLNTTGDVLDQTQQEAFQRYIRAGGGYVGVHSATDTEHGWGWYGKLAGASFAGHPAVQTGTFRVVDRAHPATQGLPASWAHTDEFYNFTAINPSIRVLLEVDESSYQGGTHGAHHPMSWYHPYDGGRSFYTNMGHTTAAFSNATFLQHLGGGIRYAMGVATVAAGATRSGVPG